MKALEALLQHEQKILARPPHDDIDDHMRPAYEACPYLHLDFCIDYIIKASARENPDVELLMSSLKEESLISINRVLDFRVEQSKNKSRETLGEIEREYGVTITDDDFNKYLIGLSERIIIFAREKLPGILAETVHPFEKLLEEGFTLKNYFSSLNDPQQRLAGAIRGAKTFYNSTRGS